MASKYLQKYPIPSGFQSVLSDFTRQVLRDQPSNIVEYGAKYFQMLEKGKRLEFDSQSNIKKEDKKYELAYNPKAAEEIRKKASNIAEKIENQTENYEEVGMSRKEIEEYMNKVDENVLLKSIEEAVKKEFEQIDINKNGFLQSSQIKTHLQNIVKEVGSSLEISDGKVNEFILETDTNKDGKVSEQEFLNFVKQFL